MTIHYLAFAKNSLFYGLQVAAWGKDIDGKTLTSL
jgi:hypothetical protein